MLTGEGADELFAGYSYVHADEFADPDALHAELVRSLEQLHGLNLQRCDRTTMFYGLEAREPFLDSALVRTALALPPEWKQRTGGRPEKALLREAFTGWLPEDLLWRGKEQFGDGSGAGTVLAALAAERVAGTDTGATPEVPAHCWPLRSDEEILYFAIWHRTSPASAPMPRCSRSRRRSRRREVAALLQQSIDLPAQQAEPGLAHHRDAAAPAPDLTSTVGSCSSYPAASATTSPTGRRRASRPGSAAAPRLLRRLPHRAVDRRHDGLERGAHDRAVDPDAPEDLSLHGALDVGGGAGVVARRQGVLVVVEHPHVEADAGEARRRTPRAGRCRGR